MKSPKSADEKDLQQVTAILVAILTAAAGVAGTVIISSGSPAYSTIHFIGGGITLLAVPAAYKYALWIQNR